MTRTASGSPRSDPVAVTCTGCAARWSGVARAHCSGYHKTFASPGLFDKHRSTAGDHGKCVHPATVTTSSGEWVMFLRDGLWRSPEMSEEQKATAFGKRS
jgi:hypothetical protein